MKNKDFTLIEGGNPVAREAADWFSRLRADDVRESDRDAHRAWMQRDPEHRAAYQRLEQLWSTLGDFAHAPEIDRLMHPAPATNTVPHPSRRKNRRHWISITAVAAVVALAVIVSMPLGLLQKHTPDSPAIAYATSNGERRSIDLQDGSRMDLDANTQVEVRFSPTARRITLQSGRAYFKVAKDRRRPFEVVSDQGRVRALGTQFETSLRGNTLDVALFEGSVALSTQQRRHDQTTVATLKPGQQARIQSDRVTILPTRVSYRPSIALPASDNEKLVFDDMLVSEAINEFNGRSKQKVRLDVAGLGQQRISGVFHGDDPDGFVEALGELYGLREEPMADGTRVLKKNAQ